jgi:hypothetical protein
MRALYLHSPIRLHDSDQLIKHKENFTLTHTVGIGSDAIIDVPSFVKIGSGIRKLMEEGIHRQHADSMSLLLESWLREIDD